MERPEIEKTLAYRWGHPTSMYYIDSQTRDQLADWVESLLIEREKR